MIAKALLALRPNAEFVVRGDVYSGIEWHDTAQTKPSETDVNAKVAELTAAEPMRLLREERNRRIAETDWWASSDLTITDAQKKYRQDLRDITKSATSLDDVTWPEKP